MPTYGLEVLVIGECIMDLVNGEAVPGGSAANVALGLGRREHRVGLASFLADDQHGRSILSRLRRAGIDVIPGSVTAPRTSTAVATVLQNGTVNYSFDVLWSTPAVPLTTAARVLHIGGMAAMSDTGRPRLLQTLQNRERSLITFDPNIRPALSPERPIAVQRFEEVAKQSHVVKLSDEDAAWLYPDQDPEDALSHVLDLGPGLVVLTEGSRGLTLGTPNRRIQVGAPSTEVVDTIGAGDTVMTSLIANLLLRETLPDDPDTLRQLGTAAVREASITIGRRGADLPWRAEIEALGTLKRTPDPTF